MPYKSKAQQRKFYADPELRKHADHWSDETKKTKKGFKGLPERIKKKRSKKKTSTSSKKNTRTATSSKPTTRMTSSTKSSGRSTQKKKK